MGQTPREIRRLPEAEAVQHWSELYATGTRDGHSRSLGAAQYLGEDAIWVEIEIPHALYDADWNTRGADLAPTKLALALEYARRPGLLPPGMASYSKWNDGKKVCVIDGNHRAHASYLRGEPRARFYMPLCDWDRFQALGTLAKKT